MSDRPVTDPAAIAARIQALSPAFKTGWRLGFEGLPCDLPDCVVHDATPQHIEDFNEGHRQGRIERQQTDDGSPSMLPLHSSPRVAGSPTTPVVISPAGAEISPPIAPAPKAAAGDGASLPYRVVGTTVWCGVQVVREFVSVGMARDICDMLNRAYWFGHETCAREVLQ